MTIEILMAVYEGEAFLEEQLCSLFEQTFQDFHLTVRDNQSTDRTVEILRRWQAAHPSRITLIEGKKNLGILGNYAALLAKSSAPYVMFCDADDVWLPQKIEKSFAVMQRAEIQHGKTHPLLVHTDLKVVDNALKPIADSFWKHSHLDGSKPTPFHRALVENRLTGCTMLLNRALVNLAGPIPERVPMHDAWVALVAAAFGKILPLPEPTLLYRQHSRNATGSGRYGVLRKLWKLLDSEFRRKIAETRELRLAQAGEFSARFGSRLTPEQRELLQNYLAAAGEDRFRRACLLWKQDMLESGLPRAVYQLTQPALPETSFPAEPEQSAGSYRHRRD